jgi:ABC-type lipoprotein release transport system permease subunit
MQNDPGDSNGVGAVAVAMFVVIAFATWFPARRAAAANSAELLRP